MKFISNNFVALILSFLIFLIPGYAYADLRDSWQQPERIMDSIGVRTGMTIGELGAGRGYFTFKLADRVGSDGKIYANDIDEDILEEIRKKCDANSIKNVITILGTEKDPKFADTALDMAVMMIAFHDFKYPVEMMQNLARALKPDAPVIIIERNPDKWEHGRGHFLPLDELTARIRKSGYTVLKIMDFLPRDTIVICMPGTD
jgi:ubiquinone/menaquinone biosynthesis C-methylase UbiE